MAAGPDGQPGPAGILALDGQQPLATSSGVRARSAGEQLGDGPLGEDTGLSAQMLPLTASVGFIP